MKTTLSLTIALSLGLAAPALAAAAKKPAPKPRPAVTAKAKPKPAAKKADEPAGTMIPPTDLVDRQIVLPAESPYSVDLTNLRGRILARGWNKNVVYVHAVKRTTHPVSGQEAEFCKAAKVVVSQPASGAVTVKTDVPEAGEVAMAATDRVPHLMIDYELFIPPDCALTINQENGPVTVVGVAGKVEAFSRDGDVALTDIAGWAEGTN